MLHALFALCLLLVIGLVLAAGYWFNKIMILSLMAAVSGKTVEQLQARLEPSVPFKKTLEVIQSLIGVIQLAFKNVFACF